MNAEQKTGSGSGTQGAGQAEKSGRQQGVEQAVARLLTVFTVEQLDQFAELLQVTHDQAVIRSVRQTVTIVFNEKGLPREFNGSNNLIPATTMYKAE